MEIELKQSDLIKYIPRRGSFSKEYGSQMKQGQERYLLSGLLHVMHGSGVNEAYLFQEFLGGKERIMLFEPFTFVTPSSSVIVFEVHDCYGFNLYFGENNGCTPFSNDLILQGMINTSAIKRGNIANHFVSIFSEDKGACVNVPGADPVKREKPKKKEIICPKCKSKMVTRKGPYGSFLGCSQYPKCKGIVKKKAHKSMTSSDLERSTFNNSFGDPSEFGHNY